MSRPVTIIGVCLLLFAHQMDAKIYLNKCDLAQDLRRQGFPENQLQSWVCIIDAESSMRTYVIGGPDSDGSYDYGLFQINDRYWCNNGNSPGKGCNVRCSDLLLDDISVAARCARHIYSRQGFSAWAGWQKCGGPTQPLRC